MSARLPSGRSAIRPALGALGLLAVLLAPGCEKKLPPPTAPPPPAPLVNQIYPLARASRVPYDTDIFIDFSEPLDTTTINTNNVFFKLDTRRYAISLNYDPVLRRLSIVPLDELTLNHTYTVEISSRVRTVTGQAIGDPYFWQFTLTSLRRLENPIPAGGATWESPFAMLGWDSTEASAGAVDYSLWSGSDSATVANQATNPLTTSTRNFFVPFTRRQLGGRTYWSVRAVNRGTGEVTRSPAWHFDVLPDGLPIDTYRIPCRDYGYFSPFSGGRSICRSGPASGSSYNNGLWWQLPEIPGGIRVAGQDLQILMTSFPASATFSVGIYPTKTRFDACAVKLLDPAADVLEVVFGTRMTGTDVMRYTSDRFSASLEASSRYHRVPGYTMLSSNYVFHSVGSQTDSTRGILKLLTYRLPPEALAEIERAERERAGRRGRIETNAATARTSVEARRGFTRR